VPTTIRAAYVTHDRRGRLLLPVRIMADPRTRTAVVARPDPWGYGCLTGPEVPMPGLVFPLTRLDALGRPHP